MEEGAGAEAPWARAEVQAEAEAPKRHPHRRYNHHHRRRRHHHRLHHPEDCSRHPATAGRGHENHGLRHPEDTPTPPASELSSPTPARTRT